MWRSNGVTLICVLAAAAAIYFGNEFNQTFVSEKFENPFLYKAICLSMKMMNYYAIVRSQFSGEEMITHFREISDAMALISYAYKQSELVDLENMKIGENRLRIWRPKSRRDEILPALVYFHGGGYVFGSVDMYDPTLEFMSLNLSISVIAIDYPLGPENPFPTPIDSCWNFTNYLIENHRLFKIDLTRLALMGDSAGASIATILSQRFANENKPYPKIHLMLYPWLQAINFKLPSSLEYGDLPAGLSLTKMAAWHFGYKGNDLKLMERILANNAHLLALESKELIDKYESYLNVSHHVDVEYKMNKKIYEIYERMKIDNQIYPTAAIVSDEEKKFIQENRERILEMFSPRMSPLLVDDSVLKRLKRSSKVYIAALEWDSLRDEGLIYASRLKKNNVSVELDFYEQCPHGTFSFSSPRMRLQKGYEMRDRAIDYIRKNL